jgi:hypothetical protein
VPIEPIGGWYGAWDQGDDFEYLAVLPTVVEGVLQEHKFEPEAIFSGWKERGWLATDGDGNRVTRKCGLAGKRPRMVVIRRAAIEEVEA